MRAFREPKITLTVDQQMALYEFVPHYHATAIGPWLTPKPDGTHERFQMQINYIVQPNVQGVVAVMTAHAQRVCDDAGVAFDPDEWQILSLQTCGVN